MMSSRDPFVAVSVTDPFLDLHAMGQDYGRYIKVRDISLVREIPGKHVARYFLRPITTRTFNAICAWAAEPILRFQRAFQVSLIEARNVVLADGRHVPSYKPKGEEDIVNGIPAILTEGQLDDFPPLTVQEIGSVAWSRCFLAGSKEGSYLPPPFLLRELQAMLIRRAEEKLAEVNSVLLSGSGSSPAMPDSAGELESTGDATAQDG